MTLKKVNIEFGQQHPSSNSWIKKLHIKISILCISVVPGPASQGAVFKLVYASPALQCSLPSSPPRSLSDQSPSHTVLTLTYKFLRHWFVLSLRFSFQVGHYEHITFLEQIVLMDRKEEVEGTG
jgi:hypothetical protein